MIPRAFVENKIVKSIALEDAGLKLISSDRQDPDTMLSDQSKLFGTTWGALKKQAMEPEYLNNSVQVSRTPSALSSVARYRI